MNTKLGFWQLLRCALSIGFFTGLISGAGYGLFFGLLFSSGGFLVFAGILAVALFIGILVGVAFGAFNGLIIAWITQRFFLPPKVTSGYHRTMGWACGLGSLLLCLGIVAADHNLAAAGIITIPMITVAGWWASQKVCDWYTQAASITTAVEGP